MTRPAEPSVASQSAPTSQESRVIQQLRAIADQLQGTLKQLPLTHQDAYSALQPGPLAWTEHVYTDTAIQLCQQLLEQDSNDERALHHLAIMHHCRAFDLEQGAHPSRSNPDWEAALEYWARLLGLDSFWAGLKSQLSAYEEATQVVEQLRQSFPEKLLRIHCNIALDPTTRVQRARFHIRMLRRATGDGTVFDGAAGQRLLDAIYDEAMRDVPAAVWGEDVTDIAILTQGIDAIDAYLEIDPVSIQALSDAIGLHVQQLYGWCEELNLLPEDQQDVRKTKLSEIRSTTDYWEDRFRELLKRQAELSPQTREHLQLWFRFAGDVAAGQGQHHNAIDFYEAGQSVNAENEEVASKCRSGVLFSKTYLAREMAISGHSEALTTCRELRSHPDHTLLSRFILANALFLIDEFDDAEAICREGLQLAPDPYDNDTEKFDRQQSQLQQLLDDHLARKQALPDFDRALELFRDGQFEDALATVQRGLAVHPTSLRGMFLKCQIHLELFDIPAARDGIAACRKLLAPKHSAHRDLDQLLKECVQAEEQSARVGPKAALLQKQAWTAYGKQQFDRAEQLMRDGLQAASRTGKTALGKDLASLILDRTRRELNEGEQLSTDAQIDRTQQAMHTLTQAVSLAPNWGVLTKEIDHLQQLVTLLQRKRDSEAREAEIVRDFGSMEAFQMQQKGVHAWNDGQHDAALDHLREALQLSPESDQIRKDFVEMLEMAAIRRVNAMPARDQQVLEQAEQMLLEALALSPHNRSVKSNLKTIRRML